jgi:hypothetical protein
MSNNKQQTAAKQIKKYLELPHRETVISTNTLQTKPFDNQKIEIMSNNKQSSVEWFAQKLYETLEIRGDGYVIDSLLDLAKAMHKEEIIDAHRVQYDYSYSQIDPKKVTGEQYYNETFGGNNEQAMIDYNKMEEESEMDNYNEMKDEQQ